VRPLVPRAYLQHLLRRPARFRRDRFVNVFNTRVLSFATRESPRTSRPSPGRRPPRGQVGTRIVFFEFRSRDTPRRNNRRVRESRAETFRVTYESLFAERNQIAFITHARNPNVVLYSVFDCLRGRRYTRVRSNKLPFSFSMDFFCRGCPSACISGGY